MLHENSLNGAIKFILSGKKHQLTKINKQQGTANGSVLYTVRLQQGAEDRRHFDAIISIPRVQGFTGEASSLAHVIFVS